MENPGGSAVGCATSIRYRFFVSPMTKQYFFVIPADDWMSTTAGILFICLVLVVSEETIFCTKRFVWSQDRVLVGV